MLFQKREDAALFSGLVMMILLVFGAAGYLFLKSALSSITEQQATTMAHLVQENMLISRDAYISNIVNKLKKEGTGASIDYHEKDGFIPVPATYVRMISDLSLKNPGMLFSFKPISKFSISPESGIESDPFLQDAWERLSANAMQRIRDNSPVTAVTGDGSNKIFRYVAPLYAEKKECVGCHKKLEQRPDIKKMRMERGQDSPIYKVGDLMGGFYVTIPMSRAQSIAMEQINNVLLIILGALFVGLLATSVLFWFFMHERQGLKAKTVKATREAHYDQLTNIMNRRGLKEYLGVLREMSKGRIDNSVYLVFVDLDGFKPANDTYGHAAGDEVLVQVAKRMQEAVRASDTVARLGGDEFAAVLDGCPDDAVKSVAMKIYSSITGSPITYEGDEINIGVSMGVAKMHVDSDKEDIFKAADSACYAAKEDGKGCIFIHKDGENKKIIDV